VQEYDFWKDRMGRYVQRGSTGIALIDTSGYQPRLRYVFDVADTAPRDAARSFTLWEMRAEHEAKVCSMLTEQYDVPQDGGIIAQFERVADKLALEYWTEQKRDICGIVADSFLNGYDEDNIRMAFKTAASTSITYALMARCGFSPDGYFEPEDFMPVFDFNTPAAVSVLGTAVSEISQRVLRQIEITVKRQERERRAERTEEHGEQPDLHPAENFRSPTEPARESAEPAARQIRTDAAGVSPGASPDPLESDDSVGNAVFAPAGDRRGSEPEVGADDAGADDVGRSDGSAESSRPIEVDRSDEHLQGASRGSDPRGADLRITEPVQGEQISFMPEAENVQTFSASPVLDYNSIKEMHPDDIVLYQVGDFFEIYGEDAKQAASLLDMNLTTRNIPGAGRVEMCGLPSHILEMYVEKLRDKYDVTIAEAPDFRGEYHIYTLRSVDHEAEAAINAYEAEFGADGTRVFRDPAADVPQPTVQDRLEHYRPVVMAAVSEDTAYRNACGHSDRENAEIECNAAVRRAVLNSKDMELIRLFSDVPEFRNHLHQEVFEGTYERLHDLLRPLSQDDIDDALRAWNGNIESKHAVVRYMQQHGREKETAAWLAREYGGKEGNNLFIVRAGSPETAELTWSKVQRRIAQLIREDQFFTEQEKSVLEHNPDYRLLDRLRADCEYFLGAGNRAEKHLWAGSVYAQIVKMRELYDALPQKPEWLTKEAIDDYADRMAPQYQVVVYHHFENGFDEKLDYQTLEEAEKAAQGYVDGTMESDGFAYDGAAIYDLQENRYLSIFGNYPDEKAQAQVEGREPLTVLEQEAPVSIVHDPLAPPYKSGDTVYLDGKPFEITEVGLFDVHRRDPSQAYPIFRVESKERLPALLRRDERNAHLFTPEAPAREQPQPVTKPVAFYPADKTHLPYDIEIQTLHIPEPEHDPPSAEPAEPEPPAMSDEERLILEQEGRAALSEMGEFVPDFDDAISQAEIDEPPAHRPAVSIPVDGEWQGVSRIELFGNSASNAVQLHAVELAVLHLLRQQAKEVADAH